MARWYGTFDNSTNAALEAITDTQRRQRRAFTSPSGSTLKTNLVNARQALSDAFYSAIDAGNKDGTIGIVVPQDGYSVGGGNVSGSNLYTNSGAIHPADPRVRPTSPILVADELTEEVTPTDAWSVSQTLYNNASDALEDILDALQVRTARTLIDESKALFSIYHDHDLTYFAWDDFTPGVVQGLVVSGLAAPPPAYAVTADWSSYQFPMDDHPDGKIRIWMNMSSTTGGSNFNYDSGLITPPVSTTHTWSVNGGAAIPADTYEISAQIRLYDATYNAHEGAAAFALDIVVTS